MEAKIWLLGSGEGIKRVLAEANLGKEVTVSVLQRADVDRSIELSASFEATPLALKTSSVVIIHAACGEYGNFVD